MAEDIWQIVTDDDDQHQLWPCSRALPRGWRGARFTGSRTACLAHITNLDHAPPPNGWRQVVSALFG